MSQQTKYEMDEVQKVDAEKLRKLPKFWRKANVGYQFFMILLAFANVIMTIVDANDNTHIPKLYFEIYSCVISLSFVVWNKMLDAVKEYEEIDQPSIPMSNVTVTTSSPPEQSSTNSTNNGQINIPAEPIIPEPQNTS